MDNKQQLNESISKSLSKFVWNRFYNENIEYCRYPIYFRICELVKQYCDLVSSRGLWYYDKHLVEYKDKMGFEIRDDDLGTGFYIVKMANELKLSRYLFMFFNTNCYSDCLFKFEDIISNEYKRLYEQYTGIEKEICKPVKSYKKEYKLAL